MENEDWAAGRGPRAAGPFITYVQNFQTNSSQFSDWSKHLSSCLYFVAFLALVLSFNPFPSKEFPIDE